VFVYSKSLLDLLEFIVRFPAHARRIAAVVAVAGAANGSPLADHLLPIYRNWGAQFPLSGCADGTRDEINDLRRDVRIAWWHAHGAAVTIPLFALVAAPRPDQVSPATRATYRRHGQVDPRRPALLPKTRRWRGAREPALKWHGNARSRRPFAAATIGLWP